MMKYNITLYHTKILSLLTDPLFSFQRSSKCSKKKKTSVDRLEIIKTNTQDLRRVKPRANGRNIVGQQLPTLSDVTCCDRLHTLLHVVAKVWSRSNFWANNSQHFFVPWSPKRNNVGSVCTALPEFLRVRRHIIRDLQSLVDCILSHDALRVSALLGVPASVCR